MKAEKGFPNLKRIDLTDEDIDMMLACFRHERKYLEDTMKVCSEEHVPYGELPGKVKHLQSMIGALEYLKEH